MVCLTLRIFCSAIHYLYRYSTSATPFVQLVIFIILTFFLTKCRVCTQRSGCIQERRATGNEQSAPASRFRLHPGFVTVQPFTVSFAQGGETYPALLVRTYTHVGSNSHSNTKELPPLLLRKPF